MDKTKFRSMAKCVLVLAIIALCSGLLLGLFNWITYVDPLQSTYEQFSADTGAVFSKMKDEEGASYGNGSVVYYAVSDDGQYHAFLVQASGWGGTLQMYVYIRDAHVSKVVLGENGETLWSQFEDDFFSQFVGLDLLQTDAFGQTDIQTGATAKKTIQAIADAMNAVVQYYNDQVAGGENNG